MGKDTFFLLRRPSLQSRQRRKQLASWLALLILLYLAGQAQAAEWQWPDPNPPAHPGFLIPLSNGNVLACRNAYSGPSVVEVTPAGEVVWEYKNIQAASAVRLENGNTLIADSGAPADPFYPRVIEVTPKGETVWEYRLPGRGRAPRYAERLKNGNTLITTVRDVVEVDPAGKTIWSFSRGLIYPARATRLDSGNTLIVDAGFYGGRVLEVSPNGTVVWAYGDGSAGSTPGRLVRPAGAWRLESGHTIILDLGAYRWLEVDPEGRPVAVTGFLEVYQKYPVDNTWGGWVENRTLYLSATLISGNSLFVVTSPPGVQIYVDGNWLYPQELPFVRDGIVMVPARAVAEKLQVALHWEGNSKTLTLYRRNQSLALTLNRTQALLNGQPVLLSQPLQLVHGTSYVPAEAFDYLQGIGLSYNWEEGRLDFSTGENNGQQQP